MNLDSEEMDDVFASFRDTLEQLDTEAELAADNDTPFEPPAFNEEVFMQQIERLKEMDRAEKPRIGRPPKKIDPKIVQTNRRRNKQTIVTLAFETDPFDRGQHVQPFAWNLFDGSQHFTYWNRLRESLCVPALIEKLESYQAPLLIYAHNGGRFQFLFLLKHIRKDMLIINGRIVSGSIGKHEIRDSFAALPVPLACSKKKQFDYKQLARRTRQDHYDRIVDYLQSDCEELHALITAYHDEFGNIKTMGSAAMKQFRGFYEVERCDENTDRFYRDYYYGGRNQCFQTGILRQPLSIFDMNSQYPFVMKTFQHPISTLGFVSTHITNRTGFVDVTGWNDGAFPMRLENGSLDFAVDYGRFRISIHEWYAALETKTFRPDKIHATHNFMEWCSFEDFIDHFYSLRMKARHAGDRARTLFYKLVMASVSGKLAQDPRDFKDYEFRDYGDDPEPFCICDTETLNAGPCECGGWSFEIDHFEERWRLWYKTADLKIRSFYNVATAASITGAARALLLRALVKAEHPLYCDTDSIICEHLQGVPFDPHELGAWKLEQTGTWIAIAGKKNYALFGPDKPNKEPDESDEKYAARIERAKYRGDYCQKFATKGSQITPHELVKVARGGKVEYYADAPVMGLDGSMRPLRRVIRKTA